MNVDFEPFIRVGSVFRTPRFSFPLIAILTVCKNCFCYSNVPTTGTKEPFVSKAIEPLVGTSISIGYVDVSVLQHLGFSLI